MKKLKKMKLANRCSLQQLNDRMLPLGAIDLAAMIGGMGEKLNISGGSLENVEGGVLFTGSDGSTCLFEGVSWTSNCVFSGTAYQAMGYIHISNDWVNAAYHPFDINDFAHEFGHYLQEQEYGLAYYLGIAAPSAAEIYFFNGQYHDLLPGEQDADKRGEEYMKEHMKKPEPKN